MDRIDRNNVYLYDACPPRFCNEAAGCINELVVRPQPGGCSLEDRTRAGGVLMGEIMSVISSLRVSPWRKPNEREELDRLAEYLNTRFMREIVAQWKADTEEEKPAEDAVPELPKADTEEEKPAEDAM